MARNHRIFIRVSDEEKAKIKSKAKKRGVGVSEALRQVCVQSL